MPSHPLLPVLNHLFPESVKYGANYVVEFEPHSIWYETSLSIAAHALKLGVRTEYHTFSHIPAEIRSILSKIGVDAKRFEENDTFRILDTYTVTTGIGVPDKPKKMYESYGRNPYERESFDVSKWAEDVAAQIARGIPEHEKKWLHVDDNTAVMLQYSEENQMVDTWRTKAIPYARARQLAMIHSIPLGVASDSFYKKFESFMDGIVDIRSQDEAGKLEHYVRTRKIPGMSCDSRWRRLSLLGSGEVKVNSVLAREGELGIRGWIKGARK